MTLNLFPIRVPIGTVRDSTGAACDVMMTPEFSRALAGVLDRIGGPDGASMTDVQAMAEGAARAAAFDTGGADVGALRAALDELRVLVETAPDGLARLAEAIKELARRPSTLAQSAIAASVTGTLAATVLATIAVPPGAMGRNGMLRITTTWSVTNSANNKTIITRFGGSAMSSNAVTTVSTYQEQQRIQNRNAANSQVFIFGGFAYTGAPIGTMAKDTAAAQNIEILAQLSNIGETITLEAYTVELIPSAN